MSPHLPLRIWRACRRIRATHRPGGRVRQVTSVSGSSTGFHPPLTGNGDSQKSGRYQNAVTRTLVLCLRKSQQLVVKLFDPSRLFRGFEGVHGWAIKPSEASDKIRRPFGGRHEVVSVFDHADVFFGYPGLTEALNDVTVHAPQHWADEAF